MIRFKSANLLAGPANLDCRPGQYAALMLRIQGLTAAGAAPTLANFGLITAKYRGRSFYSVTLSATQSINAMDLGLVESAIGAAGGNPITISCMLIASRVGDGNIFDIAESDNMQVSLDLSGISAANVASGTVTLYGIPQEGVMMYLPQLFTHQPNLAASSTDVITLKYENISHLYMITLTNVASFVITRDKEVVVDTDQAAMLAFSNMDSRIEAAFTAGQRIVMQRSGALSEALADSLDITLTAGAGGVANPEIVAVSLDFDPQSLARSSAYVQAKADKKFTNLARAGKDRPLTVARRLSGQAQE